MNNSKNEQLKIDRLAKGFKYGGFFLFVAANAFVIANYILSYSDGKERGSKLQKTRDNELRNSGKIDMKNKATMPEEIRPQYVEKQVRKYRNKMQTQKKAEQKNARHM